LENKLELLKNIKLFVLDMDGTFYLGNQILPGAADFLKTVRQTGRDYLFFTNNSSRSPGDYIRKLENMGCPITKDQIMTSGDVTIRYLQTHYAGKTVYLVGTPPLVENFQKAGILLTQQQPDIVVVAFDTTLTYEKLSNACTYIRNGALFLATHLDINCPTETGFIPDCGSFCAAIRLSTGREPKYLGKPFAETVEMILNKTGCARSQIAFVGDRIYTDVATGVRNGAKGILVMTGETRPGDLAKSEVIPDGVYRSLGEIGQCLLKLPKFKKKNIFGNNE
jgi:HAD superfamily hydrolase (TIGR01457 family)